MPFARKFIKSAVLIAIWPFWKLLAPSSTSLDRLRRELRELWS